MSVLVVGGGISGLVAARGLALAGVPVMLMEAADRLGGKVASQRLDGFLLESGPDSFLATRPAAVELCHELGLRDDLVTPSAPRSVFVLRRGRLLPVPDGLGLMLPSRPGPFLRSPLFGPLDKARMALDLVLPRQGGDGESDRSVGSLLRRRFGDALVERLAGPLVGGIYGTDIDELSANAVMPHLVAAEREHRSLLLAGLASARARSASHGGRPPGSAPGSPFMSLAGGMGDLVKALQGALERAPGPVEVRTGMSVEALEVSGGTHAAELSDGSLLHPEAVVLAVPARDAARLLRSSLPETAHHLADIPFGSSVSAWLGFREEQLPGPLAGHGFLVPAGEGLSISACTWSSAKWPARAPEGHVLLRVSLRLDRPDLAWAAGDEVVAAAQADLAAVLGIRGSPVLARVVRWPDAMPLYTVGHPERVRAIEASLAETSGVVLAGSSYRGVGLADCVAQGQAAAARVLARLGGDRSEPSSAER